jgi:hypothetical protein
MRTEQGYTDEQVHALWRDLVFQGYAYVPVEDLEEARTSLEVPLVITNRGGPYVRLELAR